MLIRHSRQIEHYAMTWPRVKEIMIRRRFTIRSFDFRLVASGSALWCISVATPAASCSLVDVEASALASIALSNSYWIGTTLLVAAIFLLDVLEKKWSLTFVVSALIVIFHPAWTIPPLHMPDCTFVNVESSQWAAVFLTGVLVFRALRHFGRRKPGSTSGT